MTFPDDYESTEPAPLGMFPVERRPSSREVEMPSTVDRHMALYRFRPALEPKYILDEA